jgi:two-component system, NarL family, invasion response regulator UvrY
MYGVLIADAQPLVRAGLRQFLQSDPAIARVGEAGTAEEVLSMSGEESWDLMLLDIALTGQSRSHLSEIIAANPSCKVLITSNLSGRRLVEHALRLGAKGYLSKRSAAAELVRAVHTVLKGGQYVSADLATGQPGERRRTRIVPPHWQLSTREFQIFCKLAAGRSTSSMARELGVSPKTVSTYRGRIFQKMKFHANADLVTYAIRTGLIPGLIPMEEAMPREKPLCSPVDESPENKVPADD